MSSVDFESARMAHGLRVVYADGIPSPWSQAAMGFFDIKRVEYLAVPFRPFKKEVREHTGAHNAPVVLFDDELPRTGWAEILGLAQRLGGGPSLVPDDEQQANEMFGLSHALMSEGGLAWNGRLLLTHASLTTGGREGWPAPVGTYLAAKYGYTPERVAAARAQVLRVLAFLDRKLDSSAAAGHSYLLGAKLTAVDVYAAAVLGVFAPMPPDQCAMLEPIRQALNTMEPAVRAAVPGSLLRHRDMMYARHLRVPLRV